MIAEIIVDVANSAVDKVFDYIVPENLCVQKGDRVVVPFGQRKLVGFVLNLKEKPTTHHALKPILAVKPLGKILPEMLELCKFIVKQYNVKWVDAIRLCVKAEIRTEKAKEKIALMCKLAEGADTEKYISTLPAKSQKQKDVIGVLKASPQKKAELEKKFGSAVQTLIKKGMLETFERQITRTPMLKSDKKYLTVNLNADQKFAVEEITKFLRKTYVLFGVTGSGKTEVYLHSIEKALERGKTALLLVPEISLTPQVFGLLQNRFGKKVAVLHSGLSLGERFDEWRRIEKKEARVVVGARSAIFAPLENIGIIIIDEEHESSYNSDFNPRYRTEDVALFRANHNSCPLVLGSATPSVETFYKTESGEYALLRLPHRVHETDMPAVQIVDMTAEIRNGNDGIFSMALLGAMAEALQNKKQALLF